MKIFQLSILSFGLLTLLAGAATAQSILTDGYYDQRMTRTCKNATVCKMEFNKIPTTKSVEVTNVSCYVETSQQIARALLGVAEVANGPIGRSLTFAFHVDAQSMATGRIYASVNIPIRLLVPQGRIPRIEITSIAADTVVLDCTLSGTPRPPV